MYRERERKKKLTDYSHLYPYFFACFLSWSNPLNQNGMRGADRNKPDKKRLQTGREKKRQHIKYIYFYIFPYINCCCCHFEFHV